MARVLANAEAEQSAQGTGNCLDSNASLYINPAYGSVARTRACACSMCARSSLLSDRYRCLLNIWSSVHDLQALALWRSTTLKDLVHQWAVGLIVLRHNRSQKDKATAFSNLLRQRHSFRAWCHFWVCCSGMTLCTHTCMFCLACMITANKDGVTCLSADYVLKPTPLHVSSWRQFPDAVFSVVSRLLTSGSLDRCLWLEERTIVRTTLKRCLTHRYMQQPLDG